VITAVFGASSAAVAALHDLEVANIPSARIMPDRRGHAIYPSRECKLVTVAVAEPHAELVSGILNMYAPVLIQKRAA
jgi:hypothetical protein